MKIITFGASDGVSEVAITSSVLKVIGTVELDGTFHLAGGAAGSFVEIDEEGVIHYSGLDVDLRARPT